MRKCVLKKWMEKMKPAASSASSEWMMRATLMIQPGRKLGEERREPHDQARGADDGHAPEHREVIKFLPIGPAVELRLRALAEEPFVVRHEIAPVLHRGHHGIRPEHDPPEPGRSEFAVRRIAQGFAALPRLADERDQVQAEVDERDDRAEPVQGARRFRAADDGKNHLRPVRVIKFQRHAGDDQQQEARNHHEMQEPLERHETREPFAVHLRGSFRLAECLRVVQVEVDRADQPGQRVQAEEGEHADQQPGHPHENQRAAADNVLASSGLAWGMYLVKPMVAPGWHFWQVARIFVRKDATPDSSGGSTSWWPWQS